MGNEGPSDDIMAEQPQAALLGPTAERGGGGGGGGGGFARVSVFVCVCSACVCVCVRVSLCVYVLVCVRTLCYVNLTIMMFIIKVEPDVYSHPRRLVRGRREGAERR